MKRETINKNEYLDSHFRGNDKMHGNDSGGFTLVEILTTMAIIGILLALLIPALSKVEKAATKVKQRAQFHSIEVALEAFSNDTGDYPPSLWDPDPTSDLDGYVYGNYSASQRLAEAVVGQDGFGFHPASRFRGNGTIDGTVATALYAPTVNLTANPDNLAARKGPYLELENANAVKLSNLYGASLVNLVDTYVLVDMYKITKNIGTGKMTGSPILYYRANRGKTQHNEAFASVSPTLNQCTYNVYDSIGSIMNKGIASQVPLSTKTGTHPITGSPLARELFYQQTLNPNFTNPLRPYRAESFILQSAGPDSLYGTADDVFNFDSE